MGQKIEQPRSARNRRIKTPSVWFEPQRVAAEDGRELAARYRAPISAPSAHNAFAVAEWRARGIAGYHNRHFRKRHSGA